MDAIIKKIRNGEGLDCGEAETAAVRIMDGLYDRNVSSYIISRMANRYVSPSEVLGFIKAFEKRKKKVELDCSPIDICGSGGDRLGTFNISTAASFVVAAKGVPVAKFGNRSAFSGCGSADVLEALGCNICLEAKEAKECLSRIGYTFFYAPLYFKNWAVISELRKSVRVPTIFNKFMFLLHPVEPRYRMLGIVDRSLINIYVEFLRDFTSRFMLVYGNNNMDEISVCSSTLIVEVFNREKKVYHLNPHNLGLSYHNIEKLKVGDVSESAQIIIDCLSNMIMS